MPVHCLPRLGLPTGAGRAHHLHLAGGEQLLPSPLRVLLGAFCPRKMEAGVQKKDPENWSFPYQPKSEQRKANFH